MIGGGIGIIVIIVLSIGLKGCDGQWGYNGWLRNDKEGGGDGIVSEVGGGRGVQYTKVGEKGGGGEYFGSAVGDLKEDLDGNGVNELVASDRWCQIKTEVYFIIIFSSSNHILLKPALVSHRSLSFT